MIPMDARPEPTPEDRRRDAKALRLLQGAVDCRREHTTPGAPTLVIECAEGPTLAAAFHASSTDVAEADAIKTAVQIGLEQVAENGLHPASVAFVSEVWMAKGEKDRTWTRPSESPNRQEAMGVVVVWPDATRWAMVPLATQEGGSVTVEWENLSMTPRRTDSSGIVEALSQAWAS